MAMNMVRKTTPPAMTDMDGMVLDVEPAVELLEPDGALTPTEALTWRCWLLSVVNCFLAARLFD